MRKMIIYGVVAPRVEHPTLVEKTSVKSYSKRDMVHIVLKLKYVLPLLPNPKTYYLLYHFQIYLKVGITLPVLGGHITDKQFLAMQAIQDGVERIPSLHHSMLLHSISSTKRNWSVRVQGGLYGALCLEVLL
jgi:hypothetical protein